MRGILLYILFFLGLSVAGCRSGRGDDSRLAAADSLVVSKPDSALRLLRGVGFYSMGSDADRAYFALLLTQAKYKCDETITSTDTIDIALDYFSDGSDADKRLRSLIYRGASLTDLGEITAAMEAYKQAEAAASPDDYENLGYINLRMASLYNKTIVADSTDLEKYKKALYYYNKSGNEHYQLVCLLQIGAIYRKFNCDSSFYYINKGIQKAKDLGDESNYIRGLEILAGYYFFDKNDFEKCKECGSTMIGLNQCGFRPYCLLVRSYLKLGLVDSADIYINKIKAQSLSSVESIDYYTTLSELYNAKGNHDMAFSYHLKATHIADSIYLKSLQIELKERETLCDRKSFELQIAHDKNLNLSLFIILLIAGIIVFITLYIIKRKQLHIVNLQNSINNFEIELNNIIRQQEVIIEKEKDKSFSDGISAGILKSSELLKTYLDAIRKATLAQNDNNSISNDAYNKVKASVFNKIANDDNFWIKLQSYIDAHFSGIATKAETLGMSGSDIRLLCLTGCGFTAQSVILLTKYTNAHSVSNRKLTIAKILNLGCSLDEYFSRNK